MDLDLELLQLAAMGYICNVLNVGDCKLFTVVSNSHFSPNKFAFYLSSTKHQEMRMRHGVPEIKMKDDLIKGKL